MVAADFSLDYVTKWRYQVARRPLASPPKVGCHGAHRRSSRSCHFQFGERVPSSRLLRAFLLVKFHTANSDSVEPRLPSFHPRAAVRAKASELLQASSNQTRGCPDSIGHQVGPQGECACRRTEQAHAFAHPLCRWCAACSRFACLKIFHAAPRETWLGRCRAECA